MSCLRTALSLLVLSWPTLGAAQADGQEPFAELERETQGAGSSYASGDTGFAAFRQDRLSGYRSYKEQVQKEFAEFAKLHHQVSQAYEDRISTVWAVPERSSKTRWVLYEDEYRKRRVVDFEKGTITWSTPKSLQTSSSMTESEAREMLSELITITRREAFDQDEVAREVEEKSRLQLELLETASLDDEPVLPGYLFGKAEISPEQRQDAISAMIAQGIKSTDSAGSQEVVSWVFPLTSGASEPQSDTQAERAPVPEAKTETAAEPVSGLVAGKSGQVWKTSVIRLSQVEKLPAQSRSFVASINRENREFELSAELLLAIMETESAFNPMAKSPIPAFGLMQIVPSSAGQDATEKLFGKARLLAPSYLYSPENNIKVGSAYFNILYYRYFGGVKNPLSRLYCAIAAYNTGPGNVSRALTGTSMALKPATQVANSMSPQEVYDHLLANLPYQETVGYLRKVTQRLAKYEGLLADG